MKILSAFIAISLIGLSVNTRAAEPAKDSERDQQQLTALAKEVQAQQTSIAENQKKIDEKLASIAEALRQAKIYSTRAR
jgi:predicted  nucleic acid-binding Zn-ribbon protein